MKTKIIIAFIVLIITAKAQDTTSYITGPHGGLLKSSGNYKIEVINTYGCITAYLFDGTFKLIPNKFVSGTIMFFFSYGASINSYLIPNGTDSFTADVSNINYYYYTIHFKVGDEAIQTRFNNFLGIADVENTKTTK